MGSKDWKNDHLVIHFGRFPKIASLCREAVLKWPQQYLPDQLIVEDLEAALEQLRLVDEDLGDGYA